MCACACVFVRARVCMSNSQQKSAKLQSTADAIHSLTPCRPDAIHSLTACRPALTARFHAHTAAATARMHSYATATDHTWASALTPATYGGTGPGIGPALARHWPGTAPLRRFRAQGVERACVRLFGLFLWATEGLAGRVRCVRAIGSVRGRWGSFVAAFKRPVSTTVSNPEYRT